MQKVKIASDSACDISLELEKELNIDVLSFPVTIDDVGYMERETITNFEFYEKLANCNELPVTSQITSFRFVEYYESIYAQGYRDLIYVAISSSGSATYNNSLMARDTFFEEHPDAVGRFNIHIIDSLTYTLAYGYPVVEGAKKAMRGVSAQDIVSYIQEWVSSVEVIFAPYTLEQVKRSGRVSCAAAFVGELLGLRPLIKLVDGKSMTIDKIRGNKNIIPKIVDSVIRDMIPQTPYIIVQGTVPEHGEELEALMTKKLGYPPEMTGYIGSAVANNCGPEIAAVCYKANKNIVKTLQ